MKLLALLFTYILFLAACQTTPDRAYKASDLEEGEWAAKAMVRDKVKKSSNYLNLEFIAERPGKLRMDVSATSLGVHLATFVMNKKNTRYLLAREKRFYIGPTGPDMMEALMKIPLNPRVFSSILFDTLPNQDQWTCKFDKKDLLNECINLSESLKIVWLKRSTNKRTIAVKSPKVDITINLRLVRPKVQNKKVAFRLSPPKGYRVFRLK